MNPEDVARCRTDEITSRTETGDVYVRLGSFVPFDGKLTEELKKKLDSSDVQGWRSYGTWWQSTQPKVDRKVAGATISHDASRLWPYGKDINHLERSCNAEDKYSLDRRDVHRVIPRFQHEVRESRESPSRGAGKKNACLVPTNYDTSVYPYT